MLTKFLPAIAMLLLPALAQAADITGIAKVREGTRSRSAPAGSGSAASTRPASTSSAENSGERWTCGVAARDELIKHADNKPWTCHVRQPATAAAASWRAARSTARTSRNGW